MADAAWWMERGGHSRFQFRWLPGLPAVQCKHRCHGDLVHARQRSYWVYLWSDCSGGLDTGRTLAAVRGIRRSRPRSRKSKALIEPSRLRTPPGT